MTKYKLTDKTKELYGLTLHQIVAVTEFGNVRVGDLGGWIEKESNLSQEGGCWIFGDAQISGNAQISGDARIYGDARIFGNAQISGDARIYGNAHISGDARIYGNAQIFGNACISGDAWISGNAQLYGNAQISGNAWISGDATIKSFHDICIMSCFGSEGRTATAFNCKDKTIKVNCGCFNGTINEFEENIEQTHGNTQYGREYKAMVELIKIHLSD